MIDPEAIIEQCRAIARQQYPDSEDSRTAYYAALLETKLRELCYIAANDEKSRVRLEVIPGGKTQ